MSDALNDLPDGPEDDALTDDDALVSDTAPTDVDAYDPGGSPEVPLPEEDDASDAGTVVVDPVDDARGLGRTE